ncbi:MAG: heavy metal transport/detoxification protein [Rikenella sp.]|nr:heavy metal transport/detoxification protein [Rikenella sp.]
METKRFKTNAKCGGCSAKIGAALEQHGVSAGKWSVDLASPEKVLSVESDLGAAEIVRIVGEAGFRAEEIR